MSIQSSSFTTLVGLINKDGAGDTLRTLASVMRSYAFDAMISDHAADYYLVAGSLLDKASLDLLRIQREAFVAKRSK